MSNQGDTPTTTQTTRIDTPDGPLFVARDKGDPSVFDGEGNLVGWVGECAGPNGGTVWDCAVGDDNWLSQNPQRTRKAAVATLARLLRHR